MSRDCNYKTEKNKSTFFKKIKTIFFKSNKERMKISRTALSDAIKNTYVIRENHSSTSSNEHTWGQYDEETKHCFYNNFSTDLIEAEKMHSKGLSTLNNESKPPLPNHDVPPAITTTTSTSQENGPNLYNKSWKPTTPVHKGIQNRIPICCTVYLLHKHILGFNNEKIKTILKSNQQLILKHESKKHKNTNKLCSSYISRNSSSAEYIYAEENGKGDSLNIGKAKYRTLNKDKGKHYCKPSSKKRYMEKTNDFDRYPESHELEKISNYSETSISSILSHTSTSPTSFINYAPNKKRTKKSSGHKSIDEYILKKSESDSLSHLRWFRRMKRITNGFKSSSSPMIYQQQNERGVEEGTKFIRKINIKNGINSKLIVTTTKSFKHFLSLKNNDLEYEKGNQQYNTNEITEGKNRENELLMCKHKYNKQKMIQGLKAEINDINIRNVISKYKIFQDPSITKKSPKLNKNIPNDDKGSNHIIYKEPFVNTVIKREPIVTQPTSFFKEYYSKETKGKKNNQCKHQHDYPTKEDDQFIVSIKSNYECTNDNNLEHPSTRLNTERYPIFPNDLDTKNVKITDIKHYGNKKNNSNFRTEAIKCNDKISEQSTSFKMLKEMNDFFSRYPLESSITNKYLQTQEGGKTENGFFDKTINDIFMNSNFAKNGKFLDINFIEGDLENSHQQMRQSLKYNPLSDERFPSKIPPTSVHGIFSGNIASKRKTFFAKTFL